MDHFAEPHAILNPDEKRCHREAPLGYPHPWIARGGVARVARVAARPAGNCGEQIFHSFGPIVPRTRKMAWIDRQDQFTIQGSRALPAIHGDRLPAGEVANQRSGNEFDHQRDRRSFMAAEGQHGAVQNGLRHGAGVALRVQFPTLWQGTPRAAVKFGRCLNPGGPTPSTSRQRI